MCGFFSGSVTAPSAWDSSPLLEGNKAPLEAGQVAQFELEEGFYEPNPKAKATLAPQVSVLPSPIPPLRLSLRILSKQDPSLAKVCCSISSFCGACAPLLPSHLLPPKGLLGSWHY